ncbi:putative adenosylhomocysteinase 3 [Hirundo rustica]|uniref:putative adenosylhomocysteinase 3 n=1 Tax=Hirundo rustica TaxID=43150 RepID=UPI001A952630|nr:putative adenosylhomocysteinase 3 [Hirundo rustica]
MARAAGRSGAGPAALREPEPEQSAAMSVQVAVAAPAVELKELGGPMDKAAGPPCEPVGAHSAGHGAAAAPACPVPGAEREAAPAPSAERPPGSGCPGLSSAAGLSSTAGLSSAAAKVPQASAMKRSDPHHPQHRHRDGSDGGGAAAEALVSPDGSVTEAPRTVKKGGLGTSSSPETASNLLMPGAEPKIREKPGNST